MEVRPFTPLDLHVMDIQPIQRPSYERMHEDTHIAMSQHIAYTAWMDDVPVASAGIMPVNAYRGQAWAYVSRQLRLAAVGVHRAVVRALDEAPYRRVEMTVRLDFPQARRWARMLGFEEVMVRERYGESDGSGHILCARIR